MRINPSRAQSNVISSPFLGKGDSNGYDLCGILNSYLSLTCLMAHSIVHRVFLGASRMSLFRRHADERSASSFCADSNPCPASCSGYQELPYEHESIAAFRATALTVADDIDGPSPPYYGRNGAQSAPAVSKAKAMYVTRSFPQSAATGVML